MFFDSDNSKEAIKTRMLRIALNYWGTKNSDELDPLVKLLMEALSAEMYDVVNDIKNAEGRILEKMAHLLAPDLLTAPSPAHAIMQALPAEPVEVITTDYVFSTEKKIASKHEGPLDTSVEIAFTAANKAHIYNAQINFTLAGSNLYAFDTEGNKLLYGNAQKSAQTNECSLWIGLNCHNRMTTLNKMAFYFDLKNIDGSVADYFFQFLPFTKWYIGDTEIQKQLGLKDDEFSLMNEADLGEKSTDLMHSIQNNIQNYYEKKFIVITDEHFQLSDDLLSLHPQSFKTLFSAAALEKFTEKLLWIKVVFQSSLQQELLDELQLKVNAFPVINCKPNELRFRLRSGRNIIPLPNVPNERFLSIKSFTDGTTHYKPIPFKKSGEDAVGTYTLRTGGLERFDSRNGREMIQYLLELLRSESAAFSSYGSDFIASTLKEMNQSIALLEQKTNASTNEASEIPNYLIVKPIENEEMMFVEYWTTNMDIANNIRSGAHLRQSSGASLNADSIVLVTSTMGGKDKLKSEEKLHAFKYGLLTRDRIVTVEDIKSFCHYELGNRLRDVKVKRGYIISNHPKEGAKRTIDVVLTPTTQHAGINDEWKQICGQLKSKLQTRSGMSFHYRILSKDLVL